MSFTKGSFSDVKLTLAVGLPFVAVGVVRARLATWPLSIARWWDERLTRVSELLQRWWRFAPLQTSDGQPVVITMVVVMIVPVLVMLVPLGPARQCVLPPQHHARAALRCAVPPSAPKERRTKKRLGSDGTKATPAAVAKEKHLFFDEVSLSVRGGQGGHGAAFDLPKVGKGAKLGRTSDGDFALPEGGGRGGR